MPTRRELLEELARRRGISTGGGATPTLQSMQGPTGGPAPSLQEIQSEQAAIQPPGVQDSIRAGLRGATMGLSDKAGAAIASLPNAMKQLTPGYQGPGFGDAYDDISEALDFEDQEASMAAPGVTKMLEGVGAVGTIAATGLPRATASALKRGAARVGLGGAKGSSAARGAANKPRYTAAQVAAHNRSKVAEPGFIKSTAESAGYGATGEVVTGGDDIVEAAARGIVGGKLGGKLLSSLKELNASSAGKRWLAAKLIRKVTGSDKMGQATYVGMHPSTKRALKKALAALSGAQA